MWSDAKPTKFREEIRDAPGDVAEIARQLRPEARLRVHVLADDDRAEILQLLRRGLDAVLHLADRPAERADRQMMIAEHGRARDQLVARDVDGRLDLGSGLVEAWIWRSTFVDMGHHRRAVLEREGLGDDQVKGNAQQPVEHPCAGIGGIFADRQHRPEPRRPPRRRETRAPSCRR